MYSILINRGYLEKCRYLRAPAICIFKLNPHHVERLRLTVDQEYFFRGVMDVGNPVDQLVFISMGRKTIKDFNSRVDRIVFSIKLYFISSVEHLPAPRSFCLKTCK